MTQAAPTFKQIKAQVAAIRKKIPNTRTVAIRTKAKWTGKTRQEDGGETYLIHQCDSPLAMRLALREGEDGVTRVLITDLDDHEIGDDILVRLKPRKLVPLDSWQVVKALFQARTIDPRITRHGWIAETLIELIPTDGYPPVASGFLDAETVWTILLCQVVGLDSDCPDLLALLKWSTSPHNVARFLSTSTTFRDAAIEWLVASAGPTVATVLHCVADNERPDALPIGLAAGVVFHQQAKGKLEKAAGKLEERYLGGHSPDPAVIDRWAASATEVVRLQVSDTRLKQLLLQRSDEILREVGAESHALLSDTSPLGFDLRLATFGKRLLESLATDKPKCVDALLADRQSIAQHDRHSRERRRLERVDMAMRLVRWMMDRNDVQQFNSLADAARQYLAEGGFVDWARLTLRSGDPVRELSEAYAKLFESVTNIRERQSSRFAELLKDWTASKISDETIIPVEQVLDRVVAPIAANKPVLIIVIDGMSVAVFRELIADVLGHDWVLLAEEGVGPRPAMLEQTHVYRINTVDVLLCPTFRVDGSVDFGRRIGLDHRDSQASDVQFECHLRNTAPIVPFVPPTRVFRYAIDQLCADKSQLPLAPGQLLPGVTDTVATATCPHCEKRHEIPTAAVHAIGEFSREYGLSDGTSPCLDLAALSWTDSRLFHECPSCRRPLRYYPFIL